METLICEHAPATAPITEPPLGVIYTSGTTGRPKGVLRQAISTEDAVQLGGLMFTVMALSPGMSTLVTAPP
jgi:long-chain acyl-CoA synthetase